MSRPRGGKCVGKIPMLKRAKKTEVGSLGSD